jgi:hypothetical protein
MKHSLLRAAFCATAFVTGALANTYELPDEKPVASVTIPSTWKQDKYEDGVECVSPKDEVYLAVEGIESDSLEESVADAVKFLKKKGVSIKKETEKQQPLKINDLEGAEVIWQGTDEDGDCVVSLSFLQVTKKRGLMVVFWSSTEVAKKNDAALGTIIRSIKRVEK